MNIISRTLCVEIDLYTKLTALLKIGVLSVIAIYSAYADVKIVGTTPYTLNQKSKNPLAPTADKVIQLMKVELSDEKKAALLQQAKDASKHINQFSLNTFNVNNTVFADKIELGMNKVPVLDQGQHGTCVTFALTGAMDAVLGKGDYLSQLCNLQLSAYLYYFGYTDHSAWEGSWAIDVINQMAQYGVMNKDNQHKEGCGGYYHYPTNSSHSSYIVPEKFSRLSEPVFGNSMNWSDINVKDNAVQTLDNVKTALNSGNRVIFGVLLPRIDLGVVGAVGKHNTWFSPDTWLLTDDILKAAPKAVDGHELIITGYDDNAVASDNKGVKHKGLLILRNSWGKWTGDWGDFYMSYDYFKLLALDVTGIASR